METSNILTSLNLAEQLTSCTTGAIQKTDCVSAVTHKLWHIYCRAASFQHCVHPVTSTAPMTLLLAQPGTRLAPSDWWQCPYMTAFVYLFVCLLVCSFSLSFLHNFVSGKRDTTIYIHIRDLFKKYPTFFSLKQRSTKSLVQSVGAHTYIHAQLWKVSSRLRKPFFFCKVFIEVA